MLELYKDVCILKNPDWQHVFQCCRGNTTSQWEQPTCSPWQCFWQLHACSTLAVCVGMKPLVTQILQSEKISAKAAKALELSILAPGFTAKTIKNQYLFDFISELKSRHITTEMITIPVESMLQYACHCKVINHTIQ